MPAQACCSCHGTNKCVLRTISNILLPRCYGRGAELTTHSLSLNPAPCPTKAILGTPQTPALPAATKSAASNMASLDRAERPALCQVHPLHMNCRAGWVFLPSTQCSRDSEHGSLQLTASPIIPGLLAKPGGSWSSNIRRALTKGHSTEGNAAGFWRAPGHGRWLIYGWSCKEGFHVCRNVVQQGASLQALLFF